MFSHTDLVFFFPKQSYIDFSAQYPRSSTFADQNVANAVANLANVGGHSEQNLQAEKAVNAANGVEEARRLEFGNLW